ncbi:zinc finger SWIM domain-containing protein 7 isoform X2 [Opisthocomus hoazin]|uniref:zinc finger SWIM domain-containing protein 7 isoform X2 n=1 Tax=Opisthocomus hoazin TaxID=30419 RepID=UPI003F537E1A
MAARPQVRGWCQGDGQHLARSSRRASERDQKGFSGDCTRLKFIFGPSAVPALDLVDQRSVTRVMSPSGRTAYQVLGSSGKLYTCYSSCHFCTCPAFGFTVLQKSESLLIEGDIPALLLLSTWLCYCLQCKHILAVYLSQAVGACQELTVSEEQLTSILLAEEEDEG